MSTSQETQTNTTAIGAALLDAAAKNPDVKVVKVVKAKDAPSPQTTTNSSSKKIVPVDEAIASAKKASGSKPSSSKSTPAKTITKVAATAEETDPAQFMQVGSPAKPVKPAQWFPETYTLATNPNVRGSVEGKVIEIRLYSEGCTECSALIIPAPEETGLEKCHYSYGNIYCPAAYTRIRFVGQKLRLLHKIKKARDKHDVNKMMALMAGLDDLSKEDRLDVLKELNMIPAEPIKEPESESEASEGNGDTDADQIDR